MIIEQLSVFLENRPGTLQEVLSVLKENDINLRALALADTADFGIMRIIVNEPEKVKQVLQKAKFTARITRVLAISMEDHPGDLHLYVEKLSTAGINIEYMYAFAASCDVRARVVLKVDDVEKANSVLFHDDDESQSTYW